MFPVTLIDRKASSRGLAYLVVGGHAVNVYCEPRATLDIDLLVRKDDRAKWSELLSGEGFELSHTGETFLQFSPPYGVEWRLDLMLVSDATFEKMAATARAVELLGIRTRIPSPEHVIAMKLHALKHGHAERFEKDFGDVLALTRRAALILDPNRIGTSSGNLAQWNFMSAFCNDSADPNRFELPVEPGYRERPPQGSWEAGYRLSLEALKLIKDRPEIFARRDQMMCDVEFVL